MLAALLASLDEWLEAPAAAVLSAWSERDALRGERVRWAGGEGIAAGIDASGALVVETANGRVDPGRGRGPSAAGMRAFLA